MAKLKINTEPMIIRQAAFAFCCMFFSVANAQNIKIKTVKKVIANYEYSYYRDSQNRFQKKESTTRDTIITEYPKKENLKSTNDNSSYRISNFITLDSAVTIRKDIDSRYEIEFWSDSSKIDIYTYLLKDSTVQIKILNKDTIEVNTSYFYNGKLLKLYNKDLKSNQGWISKLTTYKRKSPILEKGTVVTTYIENGFRDTTKIVNNYRRNIFLKFAYNPDKGNWFCMEKIQLRKNKKVIWSTVYHKYHKRYFTTKTTFLFNEKGLLVLLEKYDTYLKRMVQKISFEYEYY